VAVRSRQALALGATAAILASRLWFAGHRAIDLDEYEHAHAAWAVAHGQLPYVDFFEHHTPALYFAAAPLFGAPVDADPRAAVHALIAARLAMWTLTVLCVALTYRLGASWRDADTGAFAALLLVTSAQFLESMLEFRPDVAAVAGVLLAVLAGPSFVGGLAFGAALLFTQKAIFAAPGFLAAMAIGARPVRRGAAFAAGVGVPLAAAAAYFAAHHALRAFYFCNVTMNGRLNADTFSPLPRLLSNVVQQPALYLLGAAGLAAALRHLARDGDRATLTAAAASLAAGVFVIGKAYDQYYALLLPLLAVLGASVLVSTSWLRSRAATSVVAVGAVAIFAVTIARNFRPNDTQLDAIAWVTTNTRATDSYLGGSPGPALFRPHAWFYFFLTGPFATDRDYAALLDGLEAGRVRPRIVIDDRYFERAPAPLLDFVRARYRRQNEYGSEGLKISDASDKFDRPLIK